MGRLCVCRGRGIWKISVPCSQFCCEPETFCKIKFKKKRCTKESGRFHKSQFPTPITIHFAAFHTTFSEASTAVPQGFDEYVAERIFWSQILINLQI